MDSWRLLGIEPTSDTSAIRKTYKQQLLIYHPEDDPEGYQALRKAYDTAMNYAKRQAKAAVISDTNEQVFQQIEAVENLEVALNIEVDERQESANKRMNRDGWKHLHVHERENAVPIFDRYQARTNFMKRLAELYEDDNRRNDPEAWAQLFSDDIMWDIQAKSALNDALLEFFSEHYVHINKKIWTIVEANTGLLYKLTEGSTYYPRFFVDTYALALQESLVPSEGEQASVHGQRVLKFPSAGFWRDCFSLPINVRMIIMLIFFNVWAVAGYIVLVLVRMVLFFFRRNWKIVMGEYTFTYYNYLGRRYDFKYIDIAKVVESRKFVVVRVRGKKIVMKVQGVQNLDRLVAKVSQYEKPDGSSILIRERTGVWDLLRSFFRGLLSLGSLIITFVLGVFLIGMFL